MTQQIRHRNAVRSVPSLDAPREHLTLLPPPPSEPMAGDALYSTSPLGWGAFQPEVSAETWCENDVELESPESTERPTDVDADPWWEDEDATAVTERLPRLMRDWDAS
jgi:hypothetical protein